MSEPRNPPSMTEWLHAPWRVTPPDGLSHGVIATVRGDERLVCVTDNPDVAWHIAATHNAIIRAHEDRPTNGG